MISVTGQKPKIKAKGYLIDKDGMVKFDTPNWVIRRPLKEVLAEEKLKTINESRNYAL